MIRPHTYPSGHYFDRGWWHRGPSHPAVERCLSRLLSLRINEKGIAFPPAWRGVLLEMVTEMDGLGPEGDTNAGV